MNKIGYLMTGLGLGAAAMFILDPHSGGRRRGAAKDTSVRAWKKTGDTVSKYSRELSNKTQGLYHGVARTASHLVGRGSVPDDVLRDRVQSEIGRRVGTPNVQTHARDGCITLTGSVPREELDSVLSCVSSVPGVRKVDNRVHVRDSAATPGHYSR